MCFLPDGADCAQGDTEGFWPCVGSDCEGGENGKCDASYNSNRSTNECGAACTKCSDTNSSYNGLYKCPENTCNCNEYTSDDPTNECGEHCKVCRIAGDKNYGKYKCPAVPASGCPNPCKDCTLTEAQAQAKMASDPCMECEPCSDLNCTEAQQTKWHCSENRLCKQCRNEGYNKNKNSSEYIESQQTCSRVQCEECPYNDGGEAWYKCSECSGEYTQNFNNLTPQQKANHCYENQTCGCFMECDSCFGYEYTMQDCQNKGYDSAKNECDGKRGTVYQTCCNKCNGYIYSTDLSKTSKGLSCTECPNSCDTGGSKWSCSCKTGYHPEGGVLCIPNQKKYANVTISYEYLADPNGPTWHYGGILYSKVSSSGFDNDMMYKIIPGIRLKNNLQSAGYNDEGQPMCGGQGFTLTGNKSTSGFCDNTYHNESLVAEGSQGYNIVENKIDNGNFNDYCGSYIDRVEGIFEMSTDGTAPRVVSGKGSCSGNQCQCFSADCTFSYYDSSSEYWEIKFSQTHSSSQGSNPPRGCIITVDCTYNATGSSWNDFAQCTLTRSGGDCAFSYVNISVNCDYGNMMGTIRPVDASMTMSYETTITKCTEYIRDGYNQSEILHLKGVHFGTCIFVKYGGTSSSYFEDVSMTPYTASDRTLHYSCSKTYTE